MRLIAIKPISHSVGHIDVGHFFEVGPDFGEELVRSGHAIVPDVPRPAGGDVTEAIVIASGPSLTDDDLMTARAWRDCGPTRAVFVVCKTFERALWADHLYAADPLWWAQYAEETKSMFRGARWTQDAATAAKYGLRRVQCENKQGLSKLKGVVYSGGNSGYQCIGLAYNLGATRIVLLGFDMQKTGGRSHWHGDYSETKLRQVSPFESWVRRFPALARDLKESGVTVINATRETALECFPRAKLVEALSNGVAQWAK